MVTAIERRKKIEGARVLEDDTIPISKNGSTKWSTQRYKTTETMANSIGKWEKSTIKNIPRKKSPAEKCHHRHLFIHSQGLDETEISTQAHDKWNAGFKDRKQYRDV